MVMHGPVSDSAPPLPPPPLISFSTGPLLPCQTAHPLCRCLRTAESGCVRAGTTTAAAAAPAPPPRKFLCSTAWAPRAGHAPITLPGGRERPTQRTSRHCCRARYLASTCRPLLAAPRHVWHCSVPDYCPPPTTTIVSVSALLSSPASIVCANAGHVDNVLSASPPSVFITYLVQFPAAVCVQRSRPLLSSSLPVPFLPALPKLLD